MISSTFDQKDVFYVITKLLSRLGFWDCWVYKYNTSLHSVMTFPWIKLSLIGPELAFTIPRVGAEFFKFNVYALNCQGGYEC